MARPTRNQDRLLIEAGSKLIIKHGISGLNLRMLTEEAGVNLGMFHYYFKSKEQFVKLVLQELYDEFFAEFKVEAKNSNDPVNNLKQSLRIIIKTVKKHEKLFAAIFKDAVNGEAVVFDFIKKNFLKHLKIVFNLISKCKKQGKFPDIDNINILICIFPSIVGPLVVSGFIDNKMTGKGIKNKISKVFISKILDKVTSDKLIEQRIDIIFKGLQSYKEAA